MAADLQIYEKTGVRERPLSRHLALLLLAKVSNFDPRYTLRGSKLHKRARYAHTRTPIPAGAAAEHKQPKQRAPCAPLNSKYNVLFRRDSVGIIPISQGRVRETGVGRGKIMPRALGRSGVSRGGSLRVRGLSLVLLYRHDGAHPHRPQRRANKPREEEPRKQPPQRKEESQYLYIKYKPFVVIRGLSLVLLYRHDGAHPHRPQRRANKPREEEPRKQPPQRKEESQYLYIKYKPFVVIRGLSLVLLYRHDGAHPHRPQRRANKPREEEPRKQPPQRKEESQYLYIKYKPFVVIRGLSLVLLYRHDGAHPHRPQRRANKPREEEPREQPPQRNKTPRTYYGLFYQTVRTFFFYPSDSFFFFL